MSDTIVPGELPVASVPPRATLRSRLARQLLLRRLARLERGALRLVDGKQVATLGQPCAEFPHIATIIVIDPRFYAAALTGGTVGAGQAYISGWWRSDDLTQLIRLITANRRALERLDTGWGRLKQPILALFHRLHGNTRAGSARNIAAHYDLGNDFYRLVLDETMAYSCAIFERPDSTLAEASRAKFDAACRKLELQPGDNVLEIGTGWGGLAVYAARHYGCRVTTTTISREQHDYTRALIEREGLGDRITLLLADYRDLKGQYDKLLSIEMIEAVGARFLDTYLRQCSGLLKSSGAMLLQAITLRDQYYRASLRSVDFIQRYVFPGSFIPSVNAITDSVRRVTDLKLFHLEDIGPHYARTLAAWRRNFFDNLAAVRKLGFGERFIRLWDFYLCYCEGGFAERHLGDVQILLTKPDCRRAALCAW